MAGFTTDLHTKSGYNANKHSSSRIPGFVNRSGYRASATCKCTSSWKRRYLSRVGLVQDHPAPVSVGTLVRAPPCLVYYNKTRNTASIIILDFQHNNKVSVQCTKGNPRQVLFPRVKARNSFNASAGYVSLQQFSSVGINHSHATRAV